jgi:F-type H+-transporting ATPase subunit alpha
MNNNMKDFDYYLDKTGEIGFVDQILHSIVYVSGLPEVHPEELVIFESGVFGQVLSLKPDYVEILLISSLDLRVGDKVARTGEKLHVGIGDSLLGRTIDPLGIPSDSAKELSGTKKFKVIVESPRLTFRKHVEKPLETGVTIVDLAVPLAKGQRELVIGDRKTGKTGLLLQTIMTQANLGTVCIYAVIGQKLVDINKLGEFFEERGIKGNTIIVAATSSDPAGLIFLTPYTAMRIAEYFRDKGMDVLLILDDMTTHARVYREISLLAKRFPGRSSYPGDIFYMHAKLIERAGNFKKGSITCMPVAESILGDLSGYIQTNLMAMTDGHIFFDIEAFNQGKRPAVSPFLSVTRVGHQTQTALERDVSRELSSFLVTYEKMKQFLHFGAEVGETARNVLSLGQKLDIFFNQGPDTIIPKNINLLILGGIWSGHWNEIKLEELNSQIEKIILLYQTNANYKKQVDELIGQTNTFSDLVNYLRRNEAIISAQ